jgi:hypothetical protein
MTSKPATFVTLLLSAILTGCSQEKTVELPLTVQSGYGPFRTGLGGEYAYSEAENNPWKNTYLKVSKLPEGLTDLKLGDIETNIYQTVYQAYLSGNITKEWYEELQESWDWTPDTVNLSKTPVKTKVAFAYGKDPDGILKVVVDANNNLDLTDDRLFTPLEMSAVGSDVNRDSLAREHAFNVAFEAFVHNKTVPVHVPLFIIYSEPFGMFMCNFAQYATTRFKGEQIAISSGSFTNLTYKNIEVVLMRNDPETGKTVKEANPYKKNEYIEIKREIYRISGVNTNRNTLVLEKTGLPKEQLFSTQTGRVCKPIKKCHLSAKYFFSFNRSVFR